MLGIDWLAVVVGIQNNRSLSAWCKNLAKDDRVGATYPAQAMAILAV